MKKYFTCKDGVNIEDLMYMNPYLLKMLTSLALYCSEHQLPCVVTSIMDDAEGRVSKTHEQGRAFDVSVRDWPELHIHRVVHQFNQKYKDVGAISSKDGKSRPVVYHKVDGNAFHFHFQVRPGLIKEI